MKISYGEAINFALHDELKNNSKVILLGEDIRSNLYGYTGGLYEKFGARRILNIPLSEAGAMGLACGAAMRGLHPVIDLTTSNFLYVAMDQIASIIAKLHYMNAGKIKIPITIFVSNMNAGGNAAQHSDCLHGLFKSIPGLKIICPSLAIDMYAMLRYAIEDINPVICFADRSLFWKTMEIDSLPQYNSDVFKSNLMIEGKTLTIASISACTNMLMEILPELQEVGIFPEIIDMRSVVPLDMNVIYKSLRKTGKLLVCDTANRRGSIAESIVSEVVEHAFSSLKYPVSIVTSEDVPVPFSPVLEREIIVNKDKLLKKILELAQRC